MKKKPVEIEQLEQKILQLEQKEASLRREKKDGEVVRASRIGFRIGAELLSAVVVGAAVGFLLDRVFATKPWFMIVFLFFGAAAGFLNVYRLAQKEDNQK